MHISSAEQVIAIDFSTNVMQSIIRGIIWYVFTENYPNNVFKLFDSLQPFFVVHLSTAGFNPGLDDPFIQRGTFG